MKKGTATIMTKDRLVVYNLKKPVTAFVEVQSEGVVKLSQYSGEHVKRPDSDAELISINFYTPTLAITRRQEFAKGQMVNDFVYEYPSQRRRAPLRKKDPRIPSSRVCVDGRLKGEKIKYSRKGFVKSGDAFRDGTHYTFAYEYRRKAKFDDELLRVRYTFDSDLSPMVGSSILIVEKRSKSRRTKR